MIEITQVVLEQNESLAESQYTIHTCLRLTSYDVVVGLIAENLLDSTMGDTTSNLRLDLLGCSVGLAFDLVERAGIRIIQSTSSRMRSDARCVSSRV